MGRFFMEATEENAIRNLQRYLKQLSFFHPELIEDIIITGIYDNNTKNAVINLQRSFGLEANGAVDKLTWDMIYNEYQSSLSLNASAIGIDPFYDMPADYEIKPYESSALVKIIEIMLEEISAVYELDSKAITQNGVYDESKANAVIHIQKVNLLPQTGRIDRMTWEALAREYNAISRKNLSE